MEHSNEFLTRVYGAHIGCEVFHNKGEVKKMLGVECNSKEALVFVPGGLAYQIANCKLLIAPLSAITDEDAVVVAKILDPWLIENMEHNITRNEYELKISGKHDPDRYMQIMWVNGAFFCSDNDNVKSRAIDKLREWGYDCGFAEIPSLIGAGLAIDKTTLNN